MEKKTDLKKLVLAALFLALAYMLPFLTGQIPQIGKMLCPMHFPVLICGFICGPLWGLIVGFLTPLLRSLSLGVPVFFPSAVCMAFELAVYGAAAGVFSAVLPKRKGSVYISLILAMIVGRLVWGGAMFVCLGIKGTAFGIEAFLAGALFNALPGIALQILIIPPIVMALRGTKKVAYE
ncbi:MAG: ECF transporter S component [Oscillospiraceae bacterium]|nr:ECF transporter S component [Oscillospiraceae bacterium]